MEPSEYNYVYGVPDEVDLDMDDFGHEYITGYHGPAYVDIHRERIRAHAKHDVNGDSMERAHWMVGHRWLSVIGEEFGEVRRVLYEVRHGNIEPEDLPKALREELVQLAAMTTAWIAAIDRAE